MTEFDNEYSQSFVNCKFCFLPLNLFFVQLNPSTLFLNLGNDTCPYTFYTIIHIEYISSIYAVI